MTTDSHTRSLKESHKGLKENAKENGISQMEVDKEFLEIKEGLSNVMRLLQEAEKNQSLGWIMRRKVRWPLKKLFNRTLKKKMNVWLKTLDLEKKFKDIEQGSLGEEGYFCEAEQGTFLDEESEDNKER